MSLATRWNTETANTWYEQQPWLVGANYVPSSASNQLEMFQAATFDDAGNDREMAWAAALGMNCLRIFLHDLLWVQEGFAARLERVLQLAAKHGLRVMPVLFDSCWDPRPQPGPQAEPIPGVHNSRWVQSPGAERLSDPAFEPALEEYVTGVGTLLRDDPRVLAWDVWNEPDNGWGVYADQEPANKLERVEALLPKVFAWVRAAGATQPLTSGVWAGDFTQPSPIQQIQLSESDVISFHNYEPADSFLARVRSLRPLGRPILCTEYLARPQGSTFQAILPVARQEHVAAINWGLVTGRTQTRFPWSSWQHPVAPDDPAEWYHDVLQSDGQPYSQSEARLLRDLTMAPDEPR